VIVDLRGGDQFVSAGDAHQFRHPAPDVLRRADHRARQPPFEG
jgi:hypothetical protein